MTSAGAFGAAGRYGFFGRSIIIGVIAVVLLVAAPFFSGAEEKDGWTSREILLRADDLAGERKFKEAAYLYRRYLAEDSGSAAAVLGLARCVDRLEGRESARPHFLKALELDPDLAEAERWLRDEASGGSGEAQPAGEAVERQPAETVPAAEVTSGPPTAAVSSGDVEERYSTEPASGSVSPVVEGASLVGSEADSILEEASLVDAPARTEEEVGHTIGRSGMVAVIVALAILILAALVVLFLVWRHKRNCTVRGQVAQFPLADLLQWLSIGQKEGHLKISTSGSLGHVHLDKGKIHYAEFGSWRGEEAVFEILSLRSGQFVFREGNLPKGLRQNVDLAVPHLLMRWACATDESNRETLDEGAISFDSIDDSTLNVDLPF